ncbi:NAD(P)-dependent oxidoreductase [Tumidithrix elongata RA019]|uniref:NAD(P)-dependent oxidoreductase n=1 Tax=Tumidithrix elongata BACA0141 TaxID=2716417 RepID=A0AAW9Q7N8_9CYAN|nr:NAD(P)-dependent oxidoreductase [Tumidithrix elongata RA019]
MKAHILVTGASGYLGSVLCEHLLAAGYRVTALDNLMFGQHSLFHFCANPNFEFVNGDARDEALIKELLENVDVIIPLAAIVGAPACNRDRYLAKSVNLEAIQLINRLRSPQQLVVYPTTNSGYGTKSGDTYCTEETPLEPISLYGQTKVEAEQEILNAPNTITLRLATVFGMSPRMRLDLLVNHFVYTAVTDKYIVIFEKDFKRNYVHIRDVADCMIYCIEHSDRMVGRPYNVGLDAANLSKEELALKVKEYIPSFYIHFGAIGSDPDKRNYIVSNQRLREAGFEAKRTLDDGIKELIKGYRMLGRGQFKNI